MVVIGCYGQRAVRRGYFFFCGPVENLRAFVTFYDAKLGHNVTSPLPLWQWRVAHGIVLTSVAFVPPRRLRDARKFHRAMDKAAPSTLRHRFMADCIRYKDSPLPFSSPL
jgi:hypothetical protein